MDRKVGKNERLLESLKSIKSKNFRYFASRYDVNSKNTACCKTCVPDSNVSEVTNGSLKNIFDINNIYTLNGDHLQSWKYVRFYSYLDGMIKEQMVGFNGKNSGNIVYRVFTRIVYSCLTIILRFLILVMYYLIQFPILRLIVHSGQINRVKICSNSGFPIIYIPTYRTEMDYILLSMAYFFCNIPKPVVLRYHKDNKFRWIERIFGFKNAIYDDLLSLEKNLNEVLSTGSSVMFHLENQPLQDSKISVVNGDIIHFIIKFCKAGSIDDALIAVININYDKLPVKGFCGNVLSPQRNGHQDTVRNSICSIYKLFTNKYGICRITFCQPYSLSEFLRNSKQYKEFNSELTVFPLYSSEISNYEKSLSNNLINHIIYDKFNSEVVMATGIVCFIFLYETVVIFGNFVEMFDDYCDILENIHQLGFTGLADDIVAYALELLQPHLKLDTVENSSSTNAADSAIKFDLDLIMDDRCKVFLNLEADGVILECFYYSNVLMNHLILEFIVIYAVHNICMEKDKSFMTAAFHSEVVNYAMKLCCILQYEFSFCPPCQKIKEKINQILLKLYQERILTIHQESSTEEQRWARRYAHHAFSSDDDSFDSLDDYNDGNVQNHELYDILLNSDTFTKSSEQQYTMNLEDRYKKRLDLSIFVMWTYISQYLITTKSLKILVNNAMLESEFVEIMSADLKNFYNTYFVQNAGMEVALSTAEKSLMLFSKLNILMFLEDNGEKYVYLDKQCDSHEFCDQLISSVKSVSVGK